MALKRKPLDMARGRLKTKLNEIEEQKSSIENYLQQMTSKVKQSACSLLDESNSGRFFKAYRTVNQQLEKCLEDLFMISASISSIDDEQTVLDGPFNEEDDHQTVEILKDKASAWDLKNIEKADLSDTCSQKDMSEDTLKDSLSSALSLDERPNIECIVNELSSELSTDFPLVTEDRKNDSQDWFVSHGEEKLIEATNSMVSETSSSPSDCEKPNENILFDAIDDKIRALKVLKEIDSYKSSEVVVEENTFLESHYKEVMEKTCSGKIDTEDSAHKDCGGDIDKKKKQFKIENGVQHSEEMTKSVSDHVNTTLDSGIVESETDNCDAVFPIEIAKDEFLNTLYDCGVKKGLRIPAFEIPLDNSLTVTLKEFSSVKDFWIQKVEDDFDILMEKMCYHFSKRGRHGDKGGLKTTPRVGHVCCGRYSADNVWYRAFITEVINDDNVNVLYVDEGRRETLPLSRLRELDRRFTALSCQALRVQLKGVKLKDDVCLDEVNDWFKCQLSGKIIDAILYPKEDDSSPVPIELFICPNSPQMTAQSYDRSEYNIGNMLVRQGYAILVTSPLPRLSNDEINSSIKLPSNNVESCECSSISSGFGELHSPIPVYTSSNNSITDESSSASRNRMTSCIPPPCVPVDYDGSVRVMVSHVVSPGDFYVHFVTPEAGKLDELMQLMNHTYSVHLLVEHDTVNETFHPSVGEFCCARSLDDGNWYRVLVLKVCHAANTEEVTAEVFFVDFGNVGHASSQNLRKLLTEFLSLPAQVVRCRLASVNASINQDTNEVFNNGDVTSQDDETSRKKSCSQKWRRGKHTQESVIIAGGDEDVLQDVDDIFLGDDLPMEEKIFQGEDNSQNGNFSVIDNNVFDGRSRVRSSISEEIARSYEQPSIFADTTIELFKEFWNDLRKKSLKPSWSQSSCEYFKSLTVDVRTLIGYIVPWDAKMFNYIVNYSHYAPVSEDLPNLGPVLELNLYDVSGENDIFINAAMVTAGYATSNVIKIDQTDEVDFTVENESSTTTANDVAVVRISEQELSKLTEVTPERSSPTSPMTESLDAWDPMMNDYRSVRNAYNVTTDNLDVAITGYEEDRGKICRYYGTKYGCYRGSKCSYKHIDQIGEVSDMLTSIYGSTESNVRLPDVGAWILVRVTGIENPSHFRVQLPFGVENLASQLITKRSGKETSGEANLKDYQYLMKEMGVFYSKRYGKERSLVPPALGELVVARSSVDNTWYRCQVICSGKEDSMYKVLLVDVGITEWISQCAICPIIPQFLHLPFQSLRCQTSSVYSNSGQWTDESIVQFKTLVMNKTLVAQVLSVFPCLQVNLFDCHGGQARNITDKIKGFG